MKKQGLIKGLFIWILMGVIVTCLGGGYIYAASSHCKAYAKTVGVHNTFKSKLPKNNPDIMVDSSEGNSQWEDSLKPEIYKAEIENVNASNVYNDCVNIIVEIRDHDLSSGIASVDYKVEISHDHISWESYIDTINLYQRNEKSISDSEYTGKIQVFPNQGKGYSLNPADKNHMRLILWTKDGVGNKSDLKYVEFDFDTAKPQVDVEFDKKMVNEKYFNQETIAIITVTEAYFNADRCCVRADGAVQLEGFKEVDNAVYKARYAFKNEGDWKIDVQAADQCGNHSNSKDPIEFTIDMTSPLIRSIHYYIHQGNDVVEMIPGHIPQERYYANQKIYALIQIEEHSFTDRLQEAEGVGGMKLNVDVTKKGEVYTEPAFEFIDHVGDLHTLKICYNSDANYQFSMQYTDLAGNSLMSDYVTEYFTVDCTKPEGAILFMGKQWRELYNHVNFSLFSNHEEVAEIIGEKDDTSGIASVEYYKSDVALTMQQLENLAWIRGNRLMMEPNQSGIIYFKIMDYSGNATYICTQGFILDNILDKPQIKVLTEAPQQGIYNGDVEVEIEALDIDPAGKKDYSGLKTVYYEVRNQRRITQAGYLELCELPDRQQSTKGVVTILSAQNNSNEVQIFVRVEDHAENYAENTIDLKIDVDKPEISVVFDKPVPLNEKYYKTSRTATIRIKERNFDSKQVKIDVLHNGNIKSDFNELHFDSDASHSDVHIAKVVFEADGAYSLLVDCVDQALNLSKKPYHSKEFIIDKTKPVVNVSFNKNQCLNGHYYNERRIATITVKENNFFASDVKLVLDATLDGKKTALPRQSEWKSRGDIHTATIYFEADADYVFELSYIDQAGNMAERTFLYRFTVDSVEPELEISGVTDMSANNGVIAPEIRVFDQNFDSSNIKIFLSGAMLGVMDVSQMTTKTEFLHGQRIQFSDFASGMDDIYTLTVMAHDRAGNIVKKQIVFSVNRDGSTYEISPSLQKLLNKGFTNITTDIVFEEVNVDVLEFVELTYSKDGKVVELINGHDYTVKEAVKPNQWKEYTYTINAECFEEEGAYSINVYSEDKAKNSSTNKIKGKNIEFIVDYTAPKLVVADIENHGRYKENTHTMTLSVKDNTMLDFVECYLNGTLHCKYKGEDIFKNDGNIQINIDRKDAYQTLRFVAYDMAGNKSESIDYQILVTANRWIQFYTNKPLVVCTVLFLIACVMSFVYIIYIRLNKKRSRFL